MRDDPWNPDAPPPPDAIHEHPTVQALIASVRLHRWIILAVVLVAAVLAGIAVFDHLIKAASDFG